MWTIDTGFHRERGACCDLLERLALKQFGSTPASSLVHRGPTPKNVLAGFVALAEMAPADAFDFWCLVTGSSDSGWSLRVGWRTPDRPAQRENVRHVTA